MKSRLALTIAPLLMIAFGAHAHAEVRKHETSRHGSARIASARHSKSHLALHLHHRHGRAIAYREHRDSDGWSAEAAGISASPIGTFDGATVQTASFERPEASSRMLADSQRGIASYYGGKENGRRTSSGQIFNDREMTAAHQTLPFGTKVLVSIPGTDDSVVVTITDRLFSSRRIIDLSKGAAERLGIIRAGTALVMLTREN
ncbi:septal ring lytic transglycosylase RlpA family protein [Acidisoma cladoniae]|jgi:rare lipoprotein A|uniref:septal ring lytic transglycosylase RlpA family protein n=1 Tax=Acidisoma cladoniae TaxID=3040935 RepID=UPI00254D6407|nr:septal ring lytic transglycosylase RlpA family protein [Acidisoma sp. PAMC 29798]